MGDLAKYNLRVMMNPVADNEYPREQPAALPPTPQVDPGHVVGPPAMPVTGAPVDPLTAEPPMGGLSPAVRPPTAITPDQVRQFQEFQRFQTLMRDQAEQGFSPPANPPPPGLLQQWGQPPNPKPSLPKRILKAALGKIITGLLVLGFVVLGGYVAIDYFFGESHDQLPAHETGGGKTADNLILDTNPYETVRKIYHHIANGASGVPEQVCLRFQDRGKKFAEDMGYANCTEAVHGLAAKVTDADAYAESMPSYKTTFDPTTEHEVRINSCEDNIRGDIQGGPPLGAFTVQKIEGSKGGQWIITGHENDASCPAGSTLPSN